MTSLHERLCNWVQVHHLYQSTRNGILDAYLRHHIAHCPHCQSEITSLEALGLSISDTDFDIGATPSDASWAQLSAGLPPRTAGVVDTDQIPHQGTRKLTPRTIAIGAVACASVAFAAVYMQINKTIVISDVREATQKPALERMAPVNSPSMSAPTTDALASTREQARAVAITDVASSDPFSKRSETPKLSVSLPPAIVTSTNGRQNPPAKKPLIVASDSPDNVEILRTESGVAEPGPETADIQTGASARFAMRASSGIAQSDMPVGATIAPQGADLTASSKTYAPSPAMELTESQNRLRSLLQ